MIRFKQVEKIVAFLDKNLPAKVKDEIFFSTTSWEHKGEMVHSRTAKNPFFIVGNLREKGFITGIADDPSDWFMPKEYLLHWSTLKKFIADSDILSFEQEKYGLISINKACKMLDVTRPTLYKLIREKEIPYVQILSQRRIQLKDILDYIEENKKYG
jgi:excisionase family DNA binding protein